MKIMIVDDEVLERQALQMMVREAVPESDVVAEADNGRIAVELADERRPDLVLMDIKMPGIDGVEAVKEIKAMLPETRFIMISAFDTFEYAKEVMRQGVKEYLLKPSRKEEVVAAVQRVGEEIRRDKRQRLEQLKVREKLNQALTYMKTDWVASLLLEHVRQMDFREWSDILGLDGHCGYIVVFRLMEDMGSNEKQEEYERIIRKLDTDPSETGFPGPMLGDFIPVLFMLRENVEDTGRLRRQSLSRIQRMLKNVASDRAVVHAGIGRIYEADERLIDSYREAIQALEELEGKREHAVMLVDDVVLNTSVTAKDRAKEGALLEAVRQADVHEAFRQFETYFQETKKASGHRPEEMMRTWEEFFVILSRMLQDMGLHMEWPDLSEPSSSETILYQVVKRHLQNALEKVRGWKNDRETNLLYEAKRYIDDHYMEPVTLEDVADHVHLSPYYLSKGFKEFYGVTFIDYLTDVRVRMAKDLMVNSSGSLKEIGFQVGYNDPNYFSRVFKKKTGIPPSAYRDK